MIGAIKIGAVAGPLFEAFMESAVKDRLEDSGASVIITTPALLGRVPVSQLPELKHIILVGENIELEEGQSDFFYKEMAQASETLDIEWVDREDGLLIHYTSGSTGKPKGVYHVHNAMIQHYYSGKAVLDLQEDDIYWCTADPGWVTGTSYGIFCSMAEWSYECDTRRKIQSAKLVPHHPTVRYYRMVQRANRTADAYVGRRRPDKEFRSFLAPSCTQRRRASQPGGHPLGDESI